MEYGGTLQSGLQDVARPRGGDASSRAKIKPITERFRNFHSLKDFKKDAEASILRIASLLHPSSFLTAVTSNSDESCSGTKPPLLALLHARRSNAPMPLEKYGTPAIRNRHNWMRVLDDSNSRTRSCKDPNSVTAWKSSLFVYLNARRIWHDACDSATERN